MFSLESPHDWSFRSECDKRLCQFLVVASRMWLANLSVPGRCGQDVTSGFVNSCSLRPGYCMRFCQFLAVAARMW